MAAAWPDLAALKQSLNVETTDWDAEPHLPTILAAAIAQVKLDVGDWDDLADTPDDSLSRAALLLAIRIAKAPSEAPSELTNDRDYGRLMKGHRRRFAIG
jgi:hypothetical protein